MLVVKFVTLIDGVERESIADSFEDAWECVIRWKEDSVALEALKKDDDVKVLETEKVKYK